MPLLLEKADLLLAANSSLLENFKTPPNWQDTSFIHVSCSKRVCAFKSSESSFEDIIGRLLATLCRILARIPLLLEKANLLLAGNSSLLENFHSPPKWRCAPYKHVSCSKGFCVFKHSVLSFEGTPSHLLATLCRILAGIHLLLEKADPLLAGNSSLLENFHSPPKWRCAPFKHVSCSKRVCAFKRSESSFEGTPGRLLATLCRILARIPLLLEKADPLLDGNRSLLENFQLPPKQQRASFINVPFSKPRQISKEIPTPPKHKNTLLKCLKTQIIKKFAQIPCPS